MVFLTTVNECSAIPLCELIETHTLNETKYITSQRAVSITSGSHVHLICLHVDDNPNVPSVDVVYMYFSTCAGRIKSWKEL